MGLAKTIDRQSWRRFFDTVTKGENSISDYWNDDEYPYIPQAIVLRNLEQGLISEQEAFHLSKYAETSHACNELRFELVHRAQGEKSKTSLLEKTGLEEMDKKTALQFLDPDYPLSAKLKNRISDHFLYTIELAGSCKLTELQFCAQHAAGPAKELAKGILKNIALGRPPKYSAKRRRERTKKKLQKRLPFLGSDWLSHLERDFSFYDIADPETRAEAMALLCNEDLAIGIPLHESQWFKEFQSLDSPIARVNFAKTLEDCPQDLAWEVVQPLLQLEFDDDLFMFKRQLFRIHTLIDPSDINVLLDQVIAHPGTDSYPECLKILKPVLTKCHLAKVRDMLAEVKSAERTQEMIVNLSGYLPESDISEGLDRILFMNKDHNQISSLVRLAPLANSRQLDQIFRIFQDGLDEHNNLLIEQLLPCLNKNQVNTLWRYYLSEFEEAAENKQGENRLIRILAVLASQQNKSAIDYVFNLLIQAPFLHNLEIEKLLPSLDACQLSHYVTVIGQSGENPNQVGPMMDAAAPYLSDAQLLRALKPTDGFIPAECLQQLLLMSAPLLSQDEQKKLARASLDLLIRSGISSKSDLEFRNLVKMLIPLLAPKDANTFFSWLLKISNPANLGRYVQDLAPNLNKDQLFWFLEQVQSASATYRVEMIVIMLNYLPPSDLKPHLPTCEELLTVNWNPYFSEFARICQLLDQDQATKLACDLYERQKQEQKNKSLLKDLIAILPEKDRNQALIDQQHILDPQDLGMIYRTIAANSEGEERLKYLEKAVNVTLAEHGDSMADYFLSSLARMYGGKEGLNLARLITGLEIRARTLIELWEQQGLSIGDLDPKAPIPDELTEASQLTTATNDPNWVEILWGSSGPLWRLLTKRQRKFILRRAWIRGVFIKLTPGRYNRDDSLQPLDLLGKIAPLLTRSDYHRAVRIAKNIGDFRDRIRALSILAQYQDRRIQEKFLGYFFKNSKQAHPSHIIQSLGFLSPIVAQLTGPEGLRSMINEACKTCDLGDWLSLEEPSPSQKLAH